jgi:hypothetical protein
LFSFRQYFNNQYNYSTVHYKNLLPVLYFLLFVIPLKSLAQNNTNSIAISGIQGIDIFGADGYHLQGNYEGLQVGYQLNMADNKAQWIRLLGVKDVGFQFSWFDLQNVSIRGWANSNGVLGNNYSVMNYLDISMFTWGKTNFLFSPGIGLLYTQQDYYTDGNPLIGSHINLALQAGFKSRTPIGPSTSLQFGVSMFHYSNSGFKLPNDGVNKVIGTIGIVQDIGVDGPQRNVRTFDFDKKNSLELGIGISRRGFVQTGIYTDPRTGKTIPLTDSAAQRAAQSNLYQINMYAGFAHRLNRLISLRAGTDVIYYTHPFSWDNFYRTYQGEGSSYDHLAVGLSAGADIWMGRMALMFNYGYYLHYNSPEPVHFYWTLGGKYYINNWLAVNLKMYLHGFDAQYANLGLVFDVR